MPNINISFWLLQTLAMLVTALLIPGLKVTSPFGALFAVIALAFVNSHLWDAALFFSIPSAFTTHAAMLLVANGAIFWVLVKILPGIEIKGVLPAIAAPVVFTICSLLVTNYVNVVDWNAVWQWISARFAEIRSYFGTPARE